MSSSAVRILSILALSVSVFLVLLRAPAEAATEPVLNESLEPIELQVPRQAPLSLEATLATESVASMFRRLGEARAMKPAGAEPITEADVAAFDSQYSLVEFSVLDVLINHPQMVRVEDLIRSVELNPQGRFVPQAEIDRLEEVVSSYRELIGAVVNARERESHFLSLRFAHDDGVIPVSRHIDLIPSEQANEYHELALLEDPSGAESYERVRLAFEARHVQEMLAGDVVLFHGPAAYVLPQDSVLPLLAHYNDFIDDHALAMIYDVTDFFSRHGALDADRVDQILSGAGAVLAPSNV